MDIQSKIGEQIRKLRKRQGLSIEELAFRAEIHHNYLGDIEPIFCNPIAKNAQRAAHL